MPAESEIARGAVLSITVFTAERRDMNSNLSALDALAREGILMTEEQLLRETQKVRSNRNGSTPALAKGQMAYNNGTSPSMTAVKAKPGSGPTHVGAARSQAAAGAFSGKIGEAQLITRKGRQKTPKPWLMSVLCRLGMHGGMPWAYVAKGNCTQGRECGRCGFVHVRTKHQRQWRYVDVRTCSQLRTCTRCNASDKNRTRHGNWGASYSVGQDTEAHECERCGEVETWNTDSGD